MDTTAERRRADEEMKMKELARAFMKQVEEEGSIAIGLKGFGYLKELAEKAGSTKCTIKKNRPYFWFGDKVYVKC